MDIRLKRKIKKYFSSIYLIDIIIIVLITLILLSTLGDYIQINKAQHDLATSKIKNNALGLTLLFSIYIGFIIKVILVIKRNPKSPKIQSNYINNMIFVIKNGFHYKETRNTLLISITLAVILLIAYLYFLATGGYENNIFVRFFQTYPFKGSVFVIIILFLTMMYALKRTLDIIVVNDALRKVNEGNLQDDIKLDGSPANKRIS